LIAWQIHGRARSVALELYDDEPASAGLCPDYPKDVEARRRAIEPIEFGCDDGEVPACQLRRS
jgi:hypothetical protein